MKEKQTKTKALPLGKRVKRFCKSILLGVMVLVVLNSTMVTAYASYGVIVEHIFEDNNNENGERTQLEDALKDDGGITAEVTKVTEEAPKDETVYPTDTPVGGTGDEPSGEPGGEPDSGTGDGTGENPYATIPATVDPNVQDPIIPNEESQKAREELVDKILDASEGGHFTPETAAEVVDTVEELINGTDPANMWSGSKEGNPYLENGKPVHYQVALSDDSLKTLEDTGYKTTSLKIMITVVRNPHVASDAINHDDYPWIKDLNNASYTDIMGEERIYVSLDNGITWTPANDKTRLWADKGVVFEPEKDVARETVYTYLHVIASETPTEPTTPSDPTQNPDPVIPDEKPLLVNIPDKDVPLADVSLADVPQTGDISYAWYAVAILSACGLAVVILLKKREEA